MARNERIMVTITDDLTGKEQPEGQGSTIPFSYEGKSYEIDLSDENTKKYHDIMQPYVQAARTVKNSPSARPAGGRKRGGGESTPKVVLDQIRDWARKNGHDVADTGIIPKAIREAWEQRDSVPMIPGSGATPKQSADKPANNSAGPTGPTKSSPPAADKSANQPGPPAAPSQKDAKDKQPAGAGK